MQRGRTAGPCHHIVNALVSVTGHDQNGERRIERNKKKRKLTKLTTLQEKSHQLLYDVRQPIIISPPVNLQLRH